MAAALLCVALGTFQMLRAPASAQGPGAADLIFSNGKIVTVDERFTIDQAVAVKGDRIVAVGSNQEVAKLAGPNTRTIDLRGRTAIPGLIDNHLHLLRAGNTWELELRWDGIDSRKQAIEMLRARAKQPAPADGCSTSVAGRPRSSPTTGSRSRARNSTPSLRTIRSRSRSPTIRSS